MEILVGRLVLSLSRVCHDSVNGIEYRIYGSLLRGDGVMSDGITEQLNSHLMSQGQTAGKEIKKLRIIQVQDKERQRFHCWCCEENSDRTPPNIKGKSLEFVSDVVETNPFEKSPA